MELYGLWPFLLFIKGNLADIIYWFHCIYCSISWLHQSDKFGSLAWSGIPAGLFVYILDTFAFKIYVQFSPLSHICSVRFLVIWIYCECSIKFFHKITYSEFWTGIIGSWIWCRICIFLLEYFCIYYCSCWYGKNSYHCLNQRRVTERIKKKNEKAITMNNQRKHLHWLYHDSWIFIWLFVVFSIHTESVGQNIKGTVGLGEACCG